MSAPRVHGLGAFNDPLYRAWTHMRARCLCPTNSGWKYYGARGIKICKRWDSFLAFAADMGPHPGGGLSLDRKNTNGNYTKTNCRWATDLTQMRNRNYTKLTKKDADAIRAAWIPYVVTQTMLARIYGVHRSTIQAVIEKRNWII